MMRRDWIFGLGAVSTLAVLVGIDLAMAIAYDGCLEASQALLRELRSSRPRG
jgi:hypothetical protein